MSVSSHTRDCGDGISYHYELEVEKFRTNVYPVQRMSI